MVAGVWYCSRLGLGDENPSSRSRIISSFLFFMVVERGRTPESPSPKRIGHRLRVIPPQARPYKK